MGHDRRATESDLDRHAAHADSISTVAVGCQIASGRRRGIGTFGGTVATRGVSSGWPAAFVRPYRAGETLDRLFVLTIAACIAATMALLVLGVHGHAILPTVDVVVDTVALVACASLTALAWARYRESRVVAAVYHAAAFQSLVVAYGIDVLADLRHGGIFTSPTEPENAQVLVFAVATLAAAILFVLAGVSTRRRTYGWSPTRILFVPTLAVILAGLVGTWFDPAAGPLQIIRFTDASGLPDTTPFGVAVHLVTGCLFFAGAYASRALWRTNRAVVDGWIAVGLVFGGFAELHWMLYPAAHPGQVSTGDLLWLGFSVSLLIGLESAVRASLRELRAANVEVVRLRDADVERAALEERARLARELHDGLAQDLWLAKLRAGELVSMDGLSVGARQAAEDALAAIDIGLGDAREAVAALRGVAHADPGFCDLVRRTVEDIGDRFGLRVEFTFEGDDTTRIAPRTQAEIVRIAQEAMTNVARHAEATVVGVRLAISGDRITLRVVDNGRGFDAAAVGRESFGLATMRERAALIGGRLRVASRAGSGTRVVLTAPFTRQASLVGQEP
jgi:signal transduction histidine kinase